MPSFLDLVTESDDRPTNTRRHSADSRYAMSTSRSSSVSSTNSSYSNKSWRAGMSAYDHGGRSRSVGSAAMAGQPAKTEHKGLFSGWHKDKSEKKKSSEKIVLTSRHAAAVSQKLNHQQQQQPVVPSGRQSISHMSAESLEMRHPHSGPVALKPDKPDALSLTRIESHDEAEDEDQWQQLRREWNQDKIPEVTWEKMGPSSATQTPELTPSTTATTPAEESAERPTYVHDVQGTLVIGANLDYNAIPGKTTKPRTPGIRYARHEDGRWKR